MVKLIEINGQPGIKIKAYKVRETDNAILLNCEGDITWLPKKQVKYNDEEETVIIAQWLYNIKFQNVQ